MLLIICRIHQKSADFLDISITFYEAYASTPNFGVAVGCSIVIDGSITFVLYLTAFGEALRKGKKLAET
jgi:hypothetical protein